MATLAEEEPGKNKDGAAKGKETDFDWCGPASRKENERVNDTDTNRVKIAAGEDDFFGEGKITASEGILSTIVGVTKHFAVDDPFEREAGKHVVGDDSETDD